MKCSKGFWIFLLLVLLCFLAVPIHFGLKQYHVPPRLADQLFRNFTHKFNKSYLQPEEFQKRLNIFTQTLEKIVKLNTVQDPSAHYGVTKYSDLSSDEFASLHLNKNISHMIGARLRSIKENPKMNISKIVKAKDVNYKFTYNLTPDSYRTFYKLDLLHKNLNFIPLKVDWRNEKVLHPVRSQGHCGVCWAYSVISMIEANLAIHKNISVALSVQQMVDCARNGNNACSGGDSCLLLEWLVENQIKIRTEEDYRPSASGMNETCKVPLMDNAAGLKIFQSNDFACNNFTNNEEEILEIVANYGPVVVAANALSWQHYIKGIIKDDCNGDDNELNHSALIVGFDRSGAVPYYIVQNSWGEDFGENGFVKVAIGRNSCCIASEVSLVKMDGKLN